MPCFLDWHKSHTLQHKQVGTRTCSYSKEEKGKVGLSVLDFHQLYCHFCVGICICMYPANLTQSTVYLHHNKNCSSLYKRSCLYLISDQAQPEVIIIPFTNKIKVKIVVCTIKIITNSAIIHKSKKSFWQLQIVWLRGKMLTAVFIYVSIKITCQK